MLPGPPPPAPERPVEPVAAPTFAPSAATELPLLPHHPAPALWRADGPTAFLRTPWNTVGAAPPRVDGEEVVVQLAGRGQRNELEPALPAVQEGDQHDLTVSVRLDGEFAAGATARQVIARWENDGPGQAPLELRVNDGDLVLYGGEGHPSGPRPFARNLGAAPLGEWTRLRVLVRFSADPAKAAVSVWRDGRSLVDDEHPRGGTLYPGQQSYVKAGLHRDRTITAASTVRFSAWRIDHGRAAADASVRRTSSPSDGEHGTARSDTSAARAPESSTAVESRRDDTSPGHSSDRDASGSTSGPGSTAPAESDHRASPSSTSQRRTSETSPRDGSDRDGARHARTSHHDRSPGSTSHRQESDDDSTSGHGRERSPLTRHHDASPGRTSSPDRTSGDAGSPRDSSRHRASTHTGGGGADASGER